MLNFILKFVEDKLWIFPSTGVPIRKFEMYQSRVLWIYYDSTWLVHPKLREELDLSSCKNLVEVQESIGLLDKIQSLEDCENFNSSMQPQVEIS